jgi:3-dehydroquinate synthase
LGLLTEAERQRIVGVIRKAGLPVGGMTLDVKQVVDAMIYDKKVAAGKVRFVLLDGIGRAVIRDDVPPNLVAAAVESQKQA